VTVNVLQALGVTGADWWSDGGDLVVAIPQQGKAARIGPDGAVMACDLILRSRG
jgi:hypothetical protein